MCCKRIFRGRTFQWMKRFIVFGTIGVVVLRLMFTLVRELCVNPDEGSCSFQMFLIFIMGFIGFIAFYWLTIIVYHRFLKQYLARRFPMSCGHRRCIFTGKSTKTLSELLLTIDNELPTEEALEDEQNTILHFLEDVRNAFQTNGTPALSSESILVGSVTERYGIPFPCKKATKFSFVYGLYTDRDVMLCFDHEVMNASFSDVEGNILIDCLYPFLGFAQLTCKRSGDVIKSNEILKQAKRAVDCTKITNFPGHKCCFGKFESFIGLQYGIKGPAINISIQSFVDFDITPCIKCCEWPPLSDWPTRQRCWPSQEDVTRIVSHGCHLVAKPAPSDKEQASWRFSFSVAEVELSKLVPNTARKCLLALKIILKDHLKPVVSLSSYKLKTVFLNTLEKTPVDFWFDENIEECFFLLLNEFHDALVGGLCPHYWFRSVNLFGTFYRPEQIVVLIRKLEMIAENPAPFIFDDGCCCLYPCCTRERLYDHRGRRRHSNPQATITTQKNHHEPDKPVSNLDKNDDVMIRVEHEIEQVGDVIEHACASGAVSVVSNPSDPDNQNTSLESVGHKKVQLGAPGQAVIINVQPGDADDEMDIDDDDNDDFGDERRPILHHGSSLSKYGAIKL